MHEVSIKSTVVGLIIGTLVLCANFQFGLQTGWVSMMSMPAALLGFACFKALKTPLSPQENVYIQSVAVAVGTGPLAFGFVGAIPAIELLIHKAEGRIKLSVPYLIVWSFGISFMGIFTAKLLRRTIIQKEKLRFPSGSAAAALIGVLHNKPVKDAVAAPNEAAPANEDEGLELPSAGPRASSPLNGTEGRLFYKENITYLGYCFLGSSFFTVTARIYPWLRNIPIFGPDAAANLWVFDPSPAYVGQGMIMGFETTLSMLWGVILGWVILGPLAHAKGWAPGGVDDWQKGAQGWIMWVSLAIMVGDTFVSLALLVYNATRDAIGSLKGAWTALPQETESQQPQQPDNDDDESELNVPVYGTRRIATIGLILASVLCVAVTKLLFTSAPLIELTVAVIFAPVFSLLAIRALGETDLNPVSSLAKLTQFMFGAMVRTREHAVLLNIVAGAITEAGAQQAGDLMQDFKTGQLLGASNLSQLIGMVVGTLWSIILSPIVYKLYNSMYTIPGQEFRIPTAFIWMDAARLMTGDGLPPKVPEFALAFGFLFMIFAILRIRTGNQYIPSGVAAGVGMYSVPSFTLARFLGGLVALYVAKRYQGDANKRLKMNIASSGLILGEGVMSVAALLISLAKK